jgi:2-polyprenyl-6-methoxyphenol hydroxylase-like FAD-dependent oxidoreductase
MARVDTDVLIVGAGPTGLTLACVLARLGVSFRLIEAAEGPQPGSRGKGLQPRSLEVFDDLGIIDVILAHGRVEMPICSTDAQGRVTRSGGELPAARPDVPYPAPVITPEWRVEEALRHRLAELCGKVEFGTTLGGFTQSNGVVTATLEGGQLITARWLVGCDGGHSIVRKQAEIEFLGETFDMVRMIVADVRAEGIERDAWHMWRHEEGFFALCPLPSTEEFQLQASIAPGQNTELSLANMQALLERRTGRGDIRLLEAGWTSLWRANVRMVEHYRAGLVFLAGDAAHIHSPAGGQGMNTGIQDAYNLGWKLAAVLRGAPEALLDSYEEERLPAAANVLALSNELLRQTVQERGIAIVRDERTLQLGVGYRAMTLARDDRADGLRAGQRAPDATGLMTRDGECRLFDLLRGGDFTLLCSGRRDFSWPGVHVFFVVDDISAADEIVDAGGHLAAAYGPAALVLIRPDGYVGMISDSGDEAGVAAYLTAALGFSKT